MSASDHLNPAQFTTLYHGTDEDAAASIRREGAFRSGEDDHEVDHNAYFMGTRQGAREWGDAVVEVHVPKQHVREVDWVDEPEPWYMVHKDNILPEHIR